MKENFKGEKVKIFEQKNFEAIIKRKSLQPRMVSKFVVS